MSSQHVSSLRTGGSDVAPASSARANDAIYTSGPAGSVELLIDDAAQVERRRFGLETAEFLTCRRCGDLVAAVTLDTDDPRAIVNLTVLDESLTLPDAERVDYDDEKRFKRDQRQQRSWTPLRQQP
jgi:hypothetical protein